MTNADVHALSGAYALDALEPAEAAAFEQHLESCDSCREEVRSLREAAGALALDADEAPPASLRSSVLAGISQVRPLPPVGESVADDAEQDQPTRLSQPAEPVDEVAAARARRSRMRSPWLVGAAAALALVAGGAVVRSVQLSNELGAVSAQAAEVTAVLTAPDATTTSASVTTGGRAAVVSSASLGTSVLVTDGMAPAPAGRTYQIWYLTESGAESAGFVPDGEQSAVVLEGDLGTATGVGVTVEPAGGSTAPTTTPILAVAV